MRWRNFSKTAEKNSLQPTRSGCVSLHTNTQIRKRWFFFRVKIFHLRHRLLCICFVWKQFCWWIHRYTLQNDKICIYLSVKFYSLHKYMFRVAPLPLCFHCSCLCFCHRRAPLHLFPFPPRHCFCFRHHHHRSFCRSYHSQKTLACKSFASSGGRWQRTPWSSQLGSERSILDNISLF